MLDIKFIREHPEKIKEALAKRSVDGDVDYLLATDKKRRAKVQEVDILRAQHNELSEKIALLSGAEKESLIEESKTFKSKLGDLEFELSVLDEELQSLMYQLPNIPSPEVPEGKDAGDNKILREVGEKPQFSGFTFTPHDYMTIVGSHWDLVDTERAAKVSGSRFGYLKNEAVLMEFALVRFALDYLMKKRFVPIIPPVMVREEAMRGMGYIDTSEDREERYEFEKDHLFLVGTSEQSVVPMHGDEIFDAEDLPRRYVAFSSCFRREAGSYGKDTHGILRVHQFDKVEMVSFTTPEGSGKEHEFLLAAEEELMQLLKLPYRVVALCAGDIARPSARTIDIETWLPCQNGGKGEYRETHSSSNTTDFQARRLNIRYRKGNDKPEFVHILNGTAFAVGRTLIAILENYQQKDGSIQIPEVLQPYMGGMRFIKR